MNGYISTNSETLSWGGMARVLDVIWGWDENGNIFADGTRQKGKSMDRAVPTVHKSLRACVFLLT